MTIDQFDIQVKEGQDNIRIKWNALIDIASTQGEKEKYALLRNDELAKHINHCILIKADLK